MENSGVQTHPFFCVRKTDAISGFYLRMILQREDNFHLFTSSSVKRLGIVMLMREEQPENAQFPMLVTLSGIVMLVREEQL